MNGFVLCKRKQGHLDSAKVRARLWVFVIKNVHREGLPPQILIQVRSHKHWESSQVSEVGIATGRNDRGVMVRKGKEAIHDIRAGLGSQWSAPEATASDDFHPQLILILPGPRSGLKRCWSWIKEKRRLRDSLQVKPRTFDEEKLWPKELLNPDWETEMPSQWPSPAFKLTLADNSLGEMLALRPYLRQWNREAMLFIERRCS